MKDKKLLATIVVTLVVFGLLMFFIFDSKDDVKKEGNYVTKTSEGEVTIDLTPVKFENEKLYLEISVDTHTVDLSKFDLTQITSLEYNGKQIKPLSAPKLSGHHNSGEIIFNVEQEPKNFKIKIVGVPDVEERVFEW